REETVSFCAAAARLWSICRLTHACPSAQMNRHNARHISFIAEHTHFPAELHAWGLISMPSPRGWFSQLPAPCHATAVPGLVYPALPEVQPLWNRSNGAATQCLKAYSTPVSSRQPAKPVSPVRCVALSIPDRRYPTMCDTRRTAAKCILTLAGL